MNIQWLVRYEYTSYTQSDQLCEDENSDKVQTMASITLHVP